MFRIWMVWSLRQQFQHKRAYEAGDSSSPVRIAILDYGIKKNIVQCMTDRGAFIKVFPAKTELETLKEFRPSGYFLSNGPGDPAAMSYAVKTVKNILQEEKPLFGICLGHQLLALAKDIPTFKMHHGHRGLNHPGKKPDYRKMRNYNSKSWIWC